jgi:hypothetical protein
LPYVVLAVLSLCAILNICDAVMFFVAARFVLVAARYWPITAVRKFSFIAVCDNRLS